MNTRNITPRNILMPLGAVAALLVIVFSIAHAAALTSLGPGTDLGCTMANGVPCIVTVGGPNFPNTTFQTTGTPTFTVTGTRTAPTPGVQLQPKSFVGTGVSPTLGQVVWNFDSRSVQPSTITARQSGSDFPADADLYYHVTGTLGAFPGKTYRTMTPIHIHAVVNSYNSFVNENFTLVDPVPYEDTQNPGVVAFTMTSQNLTLNGSAGGGL